MLIDLCDFSEIKFHSKMLSWKKEELQKMVSGQNIGIKMYIILIVLVLGKVNLMK